MVRKYGKKSSKSKENQPPNQSESESPIVSPQETFATADDTLSNTLLEQISNRSSTSVMNVISGIFSKMKENDNVPSAIPIEEQIRIVAAEMIASNKAKDKASDATEDPTDAKEKLTEAKEKLTEAKEKPIGANQKSTETKKTNQESNRDFFPNFKPKSVSTPLPHPKPQARNELELTSKRNGDTLEIDIVFPKTLINSDSSISKAEDDLTKTRNEETNENVTESSQTTLKVDSQNTITDSTVTTKTDSTSTEDKPKAKRPKRRKRINMAEKLGLTKEFMTDETHPKKPRDLEDSEATTPEISHVEKKDVPFPGFDINQKFDWAEEVERALMESAKNTVTENKSDIIMLIKTNSSTSLQSNGNGTGSMISLPQQTDTENGTRNDVKEDIVETGTTVYPTKVYSRKRPAQRSNQSNTYLHVAVDENIMIETSKTPIDQSPPKVNYAQNLKEGKPSKTSNIKSDSATSNEVKPSKEISFTPEEFPMLKPKRNDVKTPTPCEVEPKTLSTPRERKIKSSSTSGDTKRTIRTTSTDKTKTSTQNKEAETTRAADESKTFTFNSTSDVDLREILNQKPKNTSMGNMKTSSEKNVSKPVKKDETSELSSKDCEKLLVKESSKKQEIRKVKYIPDEPRSDIDIKQSAKNPQSCKNESVKEPIVRASDEDAQRKKLPEEMKSSETQKIILSLADTDIIQSNKDQKSKETKGSKPSSKEKAKKSDLAKTSNAKNEKSDLKNTVESNYSAKQNEKTKSDQKDNELNKSNSEKSQNNKETTKITDVDTVNKDVESSILEKINSMADGIYLVKLNKESIDIETEEKLCKKEIQENKRFKQDVQEKKQCEKDIKEKKQFEQDIQEKKLLEQEIQEKKQLEQKIQEKKQLEQKIQEKKQSGKDIKEKKQCKQDAQEKKQRIPAVSEKKDHKEGIQRKKLYEKDIQRSRSYEKNVQENKHSEQEIQAKKRCEQDVQPKKQCEQDVPQKKPLEQDVQEKKQLKHDNDENKQYEKDVQEKRLKQDVQNEKQLKKGVQEKKQLSQDVQEKKQSEQDIQQKKQFEQDIQQKKQCEQYIQEKEQFELDIQKKKLFELDIQQKEQFEQYIQQKEQFEQYIREKEQFEQDVQQKKQFEQNIQEKEQCKILNEDKKQQQAIENLIDELNEMIESSAFDNLRGDQMEMSVKKQTADKRQALEQVGKENDNEKQLRTQPIWSESTDVSGESSEEIIKPKMVGKKSPFKHSLKSRSKNNDNTPADHKVTINGADKAVKRTEQLSPATSVQSIATSEENKPDYCGQGAIRKKPITSKVSDPEVFDRQKITEDKENRTNNISPSQSQNGRSRPYQDEQRIQKLQEGLAQFQLSFLPYDSSHKHPLVTAWTLWYCKKKPGNWFDNLTEVATFDTGEDLWLLLNHIKLPGELPVGWDYCIFRTGIKPTWEDRKNRAGGKWVANFNTNHRKIELNKIWVNTVFFIVSEITTYYFDICGAVLSIRRPTDKIALWTESYKNVDSVMNLGRDFKTMLNLDDNSNCTYHAHADALWMPKKYIYNI